MEKYAILLGYFDKQQLFIKRLYQEIIALDLSFYDKRFVFAMRSQQFYTAIEDLLKQIAKSFENHIDTMSNFHKELLLRMNMEIPKIRPQIISKESFGFLDKLRAFRHFVRHAYDCELEEKELFSLQKKLQKEFSIFEKDLEDFRSFVYKLSMPC
jgi:uncharacterized protein YutE (UPF0331/DUF86 family)